ncbi:MAG: hypothetical protein H6Q72_4201 [Firmicutes bacterium]|nr:hypothetical protein [Bacillota bacterium]
MNPKDLNEIEQHFYDAYCKIQQGEIPGVPIEYFLNPKVQIGPYVVDFLFCKRYVVEIDGHEFHKTKEQRFDDYTRERYLIKQGYIVIRFMATEVFIDAEKCVREILEISQVTVGRLLKGFDSYPQGSNEG